MKTNTSALQSYKDNWSTVSAGKSFSYEGLRNISHFILEADSYLLRTFELQDRNV